MSKIELDPAFLFYPQDFLVGTLTMTDAQVGKYIRLLCYQKAKGGQISTEDMNKICGTYDKDIFNKFTKTNDGFYYNERLRKEINKRSEYSNSRRNNRLGKKNDKTSTSHDNHMSPHMSPHMSDISSTHDIHMENEITTNKSILKNSTNSSNTLSSSKDVSNISSTHDNHMSAYETKKYLINEQNQHLQHEIDVCLHNYINNKLYSKIREAHLFRLQLDSDPAQAEILLEKWGKAFNRGLLNDGVEKKQMIGENGSWVKHFPNWVNKTKGLRPANIDPDVVFTAQDVVNQKHKKGKESDKTPHILPPDASVEEQEEHYRRKPRND